MSALEQREQSMKKDERVGLLFGYHKEMYRDAFEKPTFREQCCSVYCARKSAIPWALAISVSFIIIGTMATLYGFFLPSIYLSWSFDVNSNLTMTTKDASSRFQNEVKSLQDIYHDRDAFVITGLSIFFVGGVILSLALLVPLCIAGWGMDRVPSPSGITVMNELRHGNRRTDNCIQAYTEEQEF